MKNNYAISDPIKDREKKYKDPMEPTFVAPDEKDGGSTNSSETDEQSGDIGSTTDPPPLGFFALFKYSTISERLILLLALCCAITTGFIAPANTLIFARLTDAMVTYGMMSYPDYVPPPDFDFSYEIRYFAIGNAILGSVQLVFTYLATMLANTTAHRQIFRIRKLFMQSALNQDISYYDLNASGDFASRMTDDLLKLEAGIGENVTTCCHFWMSFLSCVILALYRGWKMALVCLSSFPITLISVGAVGIISSKLAKQESTAYGYAGSIAEEVLSGIRTVIAFGGQEKESTRFTENLIHAKKINVKRGMFTGLGFGILWFCIYSTYALSFWYGVEMVLDPDEPNYNVDTMVAVFFGVLMGSMNFGISTPLIEIFGLAKGAGAKIFSVIENIPVIDPLADRGVKPSSCQGNITFQNVHFNYPSRPDVPVLQGLNLDIIHGQTVAIVGSSGCGKSTCIQLVQRFYDPMEGNILLDNNNLKDLSVNWLRSNIGVVGQEPVLFNTSIYENIRYGRDDATKDDIEKAAKQANAHDFIKILPKGYDTLVGERGTQLSGGQKQRIAIARALVRNPKVLLLDEATSALDNTSERKVQVALDKASEGRTTIIVAHRLSTIRGADMIIVLDQGCVIEKGTHRELLDIKGHYYKLVTAQLSPADSDYEFDIKEKRGSSASLQSIDEDEDLQNNVVVNSEEEKAVDVKPLPILEIVKLNAPEWKYILLASLGALIVGGAMPVFSLLFGNIIGSLSNTDTEEVRRQTNMYCILFVVLGTIIGLATFNMIFVYGIAGESMTMRLRSKMFEAIMRQEIGWFDEKSNTTGALCARLSGDAGAVQGATGQRIGTIVQSVATLMVAIVLALVYQWKLGLVALSTAPFMLFTTYLDRTVAMSESFGATQAMQKSTQIAVDSLSNIRTVVSLGREKTFCNEFAEALTPAMKQAIINTHYRGFVYGFARGLLFFSIAGIIYYGGYLIENEGVEFQQILKVMQVLMMSTGSIANALAFTPNLQKGIISASRIVALITRQPKIVDAPNAKDSFDAVGNVQYDNVTFSYPTRSYVQVLKGLKLAVEKGTTVALVGSSGCGKSTCIQLLERFYDPDDGTVSVDAEPIKGLKMSELRKNMGIVSQEPILFDRTIGENIAYGANDREATEQEIIEVARQANVHNFIVSLPLGYNTRLGTKGAQLSGGQKQRVAIARALLRNPRILLLDEATSALDTESEKVVQEALDKARLGRTCITIAHRLSTIKDADTICVFNDGVIAELGTHHELIDKKGLYYKLQMQHAS